MSQRTYPHLADRLLNTPLLLHPQKLDAILAKQVADAEKRARADHLIDTGHGLDHAAAQVAALLAKLRADA